ncbi:MAG: hypothetical protein ABI083_01395 [Lapillicoccus sp.]
MPDKDVDEQFAAIMAHWDDVAMGLDPFGDPVADDAEGPEDAAPPDRSDGSHGSDISDRGAPESGAASGARPNEQVTDRPAIDTTEVEALADQEARRQAAPEPAAAPEPIVDIPARPAGSGWRQHDVADVEEHFVPPPVAPLPSADDKHFWLMMVGLIGGPLIFLYLILFNRDGNGWWMMFALGMAIAGFVLLVLRQPNQRDENDDGVRL